jgi:hypothetical protein
MIILVETLITNIFNKGKKVSILENNFLQVLFQEI